MAAGHLFLSSTFYTGGSPHIKIFSVSLTTPQKKASFFKGELTTLCGKCLDFQSKLKTPWRESPNSVFTKSMKPRRQMPKSLLSKLTTL